MKYKEREPGQIMGISKSYIQDFSPLLVEQVQHKLTRPNSLHECWTEYYPLTLSASYLTNYEIGMLSHLMDFINNERRKSPDVEERALRERNEETSSVVGKPSAIKSRYR